MIDSSLMSFNDWTESIKNIVETIAVIVGGGWVLFRFGLFRERFPSMEIQNGINYIGENSSEYLIELYCIVENKGKVRKWIAPLDFELFYLKKNDIFESKVSLNDEINFNKFSRTNTHYNNRKYWVQPDWYIPFVDGESKKRFHHLTVIPKDFKYLILNTRFIDFNDKTRATKYIISLTEINKRVVGKSWEEKSFKERLLENSSKKTDFYYTQITLDIDLLKQNVT